MKFLLVNPFVTDFACYDYWMKPLGMLYLSAILKEQGHTVQFLDCMDRDHSALPSSEAGPYGKGEFCSAPFAKPGPLAGYPRNYRSFGISGKLLNKLLEKLSDPDLIIVTSGMTYWYPGVRETAHMLKERFTGTPLLLGGIYATLCPEHADENIPAERVPGGAGFSGLGEFCGVRIPPFSEWPPPDYSGYRKLVYAALRTSAGCPRSCPYCGIKKLHPGFEYKNAGAVKREIEHLAGSYRVKDIVFYDDALLAAPGFAGYLESPVSGIRLHTPNGLEVERIDAQSASLLKNSGFTDPCISVDALSFSEDEKRGQVPRGDVIRAAGALIGAGYGKGEFSAYLILGIPGRELKELCEAIEFVHGLGARVRLAEYAVVPGSDDAGGFPDSVISEPLLHNNSLYPSFAIDDWREVFRVKQYAARLNLLHRN